MAPRLIQLAVILYGLLALVAVSWGVLAGHPDLYHHPAPWAPVSFPVSTVLAIGLGAGVGLLVVASTRVLVRRARWAQTLHVEFRRLLGPLAPGQIAVLALCSGVAEEMLFRGAMQPTLGLVPSALIFGAVHLGPGRRFVPWTLWAGIMGFVFGGLYWLTGELAAPVVAHVVINYENLHFIESYDPTPRSGGGHENTGRSWDGPSLVSSRLRTGGRN